MVFFEKLFRPWSFELTRHIHNLLPFTRPQHALATLIEFSCRHSDAYRFIFSARYRASPFCALPLYTCSLSVRFESTATLGRRGWKRPSYINSVAECRRDNNDLTAVRRSAFYRRCSCARGCSRESGVTIPVPGSPYRTLRVETILALALFSQRSFSFSFNQYSRAAPYLLARLQASVIGPFWRQLRDFSNRRLGFARTAEKNIVRKRSRDRHRERTLLTI